MSLELIIIELELKQNIKIGDGDSSLTLGMTRQSCCISGKQRRFAQRIASAFQYVT
jgi:hypothetical protein